MYQAVLFDLDNTLVDDYESTRQALAKACAKAVDLVPSLSLHDLGDAYWRVSLEVWNAVEASLISGGSLAALTGAAYRWECWSRALAACDVMDEAVVTEVVETYAYWRDELLPLFPETEETLETLRTHVKLGIVTNGTADTHRRKLQKLKFDERFDCCVIAGEYGPAKPDPAIFVYTAELLGVPPEACLMVGDNIDTDVVGAKAAGMQAVWFNRENFPLPAGGAQPDHVIANLLHVIPLVLSTKG